MGANAGTIGQVGTGLQIAGVLGSTLGAYKKSKGEQSGYEFQSKIAANNADIAEMQAKDAILRGQKTEQGVRLKGAQLKGAQIAALAARGLDLGEGSPLDLLTGTDAGVDRDVLLAQDNTNKEVWGLRSQAANFRANSDLLAWRGDQENPAGDAFGTLLTGAGKVASSWYSMRNATSRDVT